jgi:hypothetical protein
MEFGEAIALGGEKLLLLLLIIRLCLKLSCVLAIKELKWGDFSDKKEADEEESGIADDKFAAVFVVAAAAAALLQLVVVFEWKIEETPITVEVEAILSSSSLFPAPLLKVRQRVYGKIERRKDWDIFRV